MTLIALLLLYPTPLLSPSGPDATSPGAQIRTLAAAPVFRDQRAVSSSDDPAGGTACAEEESDDDQRAEFVLACPALRRPGRQHDRPSRQPSSLLSFPSSVRSTRLRC
jgi:hypothetical protein